MSRTVILNVILNVQLNGGKWTFFLISFIKRIQNDEICDQKIILSVTES